MISFIRLAPAFAKARPSALIFAAIEKAPRSDRQGRR
jgi:hypothetical protein